MTSRVLENLNSADSSVVIRNGSIGDYTDGLHAIRFCIHSTLEMFVQKRLGNGKTVLDSMSMYEYDLKE